MNTEEHFERWYNRTFKTKTVNTRHINDCELAFHAGYAAALEDRDDDLYSSPINPRKDFQGWLEERARFYRGLR